MSVISNVVKTLSMVALLSTSTVFAADILVNTSIADSSSDEVGGDKYKVDSMNVLWTDDGNVTVDVYTNFVDYNNRQSVGGNGKNIVLGDLLIGTGNDASAFDYAFKLTDGRYDDFMQVGHAQNDGGLYAISSTKSAKEFHGDDASVQNGAVLGRRDGDVLDNGFWTVDTQMMNDGFDKISFNFNVSGIAAFQNASQISFSWAMSCANDIVQGVVAKTGNASIPEPATVFLMLMALGLIGFKQNRKAKNFSA